MSEVKDGDTVHLHYSGKFEDGTVFDSTDGGEPIEFVAGSDQLIQGVGQAVLGMTEGEKKTITVPPEEGYGEHKEELVQQVPRDKLPGDIAVGDELTAQVGEEEYRVWVAELGEAEATIDGNHPLAGETLVFDIEVQCIHAPE